MARLLVTVGTDGFTDWVQLPDGSKLSLGPVSILTFVTKLCPSGQMAKRTLEGLLQDKAAMVAVDDDKMWAMLTPRRARWAADSFMIRDQRNTPTSRRGTNMGSIDRDLTAIENHLVALSKAAKAGASPEKMSEGLNILTKLACDYSGLDETVPEPPSPAPALDPSTPQAPSVDGLAYDIYTANSGLVEQIVSQSEATVDRVDKLVEAGKKFNADRAKADIHAVTSKVAGIVQDTDLTAPWIADDLEKLAARSQQLHDLFVPAKV